MEFLVMLMAVFGLEAAPGMQLEPMMRIDSQECCRVVAAPIPEPNLYTSTLTPPTL